MPVLLIYGAADQRVPPAESAARIRDELARLGRAADVTVRILPGADHSFRLSPGPSGWPNTAPDYLATDLGSESCVGDRNDLREATNVAMGSGRL